MKRRLWSVLLATCMVLTLIPFSAFAAGDTTEVSDAAALESAIENVAYKTITLTDNITLSDWLIIERSVTLDLGGHTLTANNYSPYVWPDPGTPIDVTIKNGNISVFGPNYPGLRVKGSANLDLQGVQITSTEGAGLYLAHDPKDTNILNVNLDGSSSVTGTCGISIRGSADYLASGTAPGPVSPTSLINLNIDGTSVRSTGTVAAISGNGLDRSNTAIKINGNANISSNQVCAIYLPQPGTVTIGETGTPTIEGTSAIGIKSGSLIIKNGIFTATGDYLDLHPANSNGIDEDGSVICAEANSAYVGDMVIDIQGGTFESTNGHIVCEYTGNASPVALKSLSISGGTFIGGTDGTTPRELFLLHEESTLAKCVTGGSFSTPVEKKYLADGFEWEAKSASGTTPYTYHASLEDAQKAAGLTGTVTERNDNSISVTVDHDDGVRPQTIYKVASGSTFKFPAAPETVKNGYDSFGGWQAAVGETKEVYQPEATMTVSADTTVSPYWVKNADGIKLSLPETDTKHTLVEPTTENPDYALLFFKDEIPADPSTATEVALLQAEVLTSGTIPATNQNVIWKSDDESIVTVNANGGIIPVGVGSTKITATVEGTEIQTVCVVTVTAPATTPSGKDLEATPKEEVKLPTTEELEKLPEDMQTVDQIKTALQVKLVSMTSMTKEDVGTPNQKPSGATQTSGSAIYELEVTYEGENIPLTDEQVQKEGGVWVTIPYPDNLVGNPNDFDFIIIHLSLSSGQFETIIPEKSSGGLRFFMSGFSPIIIGWSTTPIKTVTTSEPAIPPKDDDTPSSPSPSVVISGITTNRRPGGTTTADPKPSDSPNATPSTTPSTTTPTALPFKDVEANAWYLDAVNFVYAKGLMKGIDDSTFAPKADTSRAMLVTMLYRLEGEPEATPADFNDVRADFWYTDAIGWATANGIVNGYGNGAFGPEDPLTREQAATIFYRYTKFKGIDTDKTADLSAFSDNETISSFAVDAMAWANAVQLINGTSETTLSPAGSAERAQIATILMRYCNNIITDLV